MYHTPAFQSLAAVAAHLPYHLDDTEQANATFRRCCEGGTAADRQHLALWTYCFTLRYFMVKFVRTPSDTPSDMEALIEKTFRKIERHRPSLPCDTRYASWVSVICKNTYLNYRRRQRRYVSLDEPDRTPLEAERVEPARDIGEAAQVVFQAILRLPKGLQEVARLRLLEDRSYSEMGEMTGKSLPTLRAYVNKAVRRLRDDVHLRAYLETEEPRFLKF